MHAIPNPPFTLDEGAGAVKHDKGKMTNSQVVAVSLPSFIISLPPHSAMNVFKICKQLWPNNVPHNTYKLS